MGKVICSLPVCQLLYMSFVSMGEVPSFPFAKQDKLSPMFYKVVSERWAPVYIMSDSLSHFMLSFTVQFG